MGITMLIRQAESNDAGAVIALFELLYGETAFLLYEPGELTPQVNEYARRIAENAKNANGVMFVAQIGEEIVGVIFGNRGIARKNRHSLFLVLGVRQSCWKQGIGRALLRAVETWASERALHRLELTVQTTNSRAIALYEGAGFEREGTKRHSLKTNGKYVDEFLMSKLLVA